MSITDYVFRSVMWGVHKIGIGVLGTLLILVAILVSISTSLMTIVNTPSYISFNWIAIYGLLFGWLLGRTAISGRNASVCSSLLGVVWVFVHVQELSDTLASLVWEIIARAWESSTLLTATPLPNLSMVILQWQEMFTGFFDLVMHLAPWAGAILHGAPIYDPLATSFVWGLAIWGAAFWAGWAIRRLEKPSEAVLPGGLLLIISLSYTRSSFWNLIPVLGGSLILIPWIGFFQRRRYWDQKNIDYSEDINMDLVLWTLMLISVTVTSALLLSYISPENIAQWVHELQKPPESEQATLGESLGLVQGAVNEGTETGRTGFGELPRNHLIGAGPELSFRPVMTIKTDRLFISKPDLSNRSPQPSFYWRAVNYDIYTGHGWATSQTSATQYLPSQSIASASGSALIPLEQEVTLVDNTNPMIYFAGELDSVIDQPYRIDWRIVEYSENPNAHQRSMEDLFRAVLDDKGSISSYRVKSILHAVGTDQLRAAGEEYPIWILYRYLQLPADVPQRVIDLAIELTTTALTPFDSALALESYLRSIPYTLDVPLPPSNRDVADYFLFSLRKGYCDYYATAMVVMARAVGLPARLVMGYTTGKYDPEEKLFNVSEADAHTWVEIYFPDIGWVEFEPTAGQPAINRPASAPQIEIPANQEEQTPFAENTWLAGSDWFITAAAVCGAVVFAILILMQYEVWQLKRMAPAEASATLYRRLYLQGRRMDIPTLPGKTPHEFGNDLNKQVTGLLTRSRWQKALTSAPQETEKLVDLYAKTIYSSQAPSIQAREEAIHTWKQLRCRLWLARLLVMWKKRKMISEPKYPDRE